MIRLSKQQRATATECAERICTELNKHAPAGAVYSAGWTNRNRALAFSRTDSAGTRYHTLADPMSAYWSTVRVSREVAAALRGDRENVIPIGRGKK